MTFHDAMKRACDAHDPSYYGKFKPWADTYFFLPHRGQARGVGGIFYDHLNTGDFEKDFAFTRDVGLALLDVYPRIVRKRMMEPWTESRAGAATGLPRALCRVQSALRPRNDVRASDRRQYRNHPEFDAAIGELGIDAFQGAGRRRHAMDDYLGFIEFFVVAMFVMAWGVLELVGRRLDRKKEAERAKQQNATPPS